MYRGHKVICVTPAGRRRYMRVLVPYIVSDPLVDEYQIWVNTTDAADLAFLENLAEKFPNIRLIRLPPGVEVDGIRSIRRFFPTAIDSNTVYVRFDDDVVYVEDDFLPGFLEFRMQHPEYFLTLPLIINNAICTALLVHLGKINIGNSRIKAYCEDDLGWKNADFAKVLHEQFLKMLEKGNIDGLKIPNREMCIGRISINCIAWFGADFAQFGGFIGHTDEEEWLSVIKPIQTGRLNGIYGNKIVSHFAFLPQRYLLDMTVILSRYEKLSQMRHPEAYKLASEALTAANALEKPQT